MAKVLLARMMVPSMSLGALFALMTVLRAPLMATKTGFRIIRERVVKRGHTTKAKRAVQPSQLTKF